MDFYLSKIFVKEQLGKKEYERVLFIRGQYSKWYRVIAVFTDDDQANKFMSENEGTAVLTQNGNAIVIVMKNDLGVTTV